MKPDMPNDIIAAIATPAGQGGVGMIRVSGPGSIELVGRIFKAAKRPLESLKGYEASYGHIVDPDDKARAVDEAVALVFKAPHSFTTQDTVEITSHGGKALLQKCLDLCFKQGARPASGGEFTKRAFLGGRIDLLEAENVLSLIRAETDTALDAAQKNLNHSLSRRMTQVRDTLTDVLSHIEATLDFPEDEIEPKETEEWKKDLSAQKEVLDTLVENCRYGVRVQEGIRIAIVGRPNVGKSSLMNALVGHSRVIVSSEEGTTRDVVEEVLDIEGYMVRLGDTAGIRSTDSAIEKESIKRTKEVIETADLLLYAVDASKTPDPDEKRFLEEWTSKPIVPVLNKSDLGSPCAEWPDLFTGMRSCSTSCVKDEGLEELQMLIGESIRAMMPSQSQEVWSGTIRQLNLLRKASSAISDALQGIADTRSAEFIAADLRLALEALGEMVGEVVTDDILDRIFSRFCIGK